MGEHETVLVQLKDGPCEIDKNVVELVTTIDGINGIKTNNSCQGTPREDASLRTNVKHYAQIGFSPEDVADFPANTASIEVCSEFVMHFLDLIAPDLEAMEKAREDDTTDDNPVEFHLWAKPALSMVMYWNPSPEIYPAVLKAAKGAAQRMK